MRRLATTLALAAAMFLGAGIAYASIPDSSGTIDGCYDT